MTLQTLTMAALRSLITKRNETKPWLSHRENYFTISLYSTLCLYHRRSITVTGKTTRTIHRLLLSCVPFTGDPSTALLKEIPSNPKFLIVNVCLYIRQRGDFCGKYLLSSRLYLRLQGMFDL